MCQKKNNATITNYNIFNCCSCEFEVSSQCSHGDMNKNIPGLLILKKHSCQVVESTIRDIAIEDRPHPLPHLLPYVMFSNLTKMWVWSEVLMGSGLNRRGTRSKHETMSRYRTGTLTMIIQGLRSPPVNMSET